MQALCILRGFSRVREVHKGGMQNFQASPTADLVQTAKMLEAAVAQKTEIYRDEFGAKQPLIMV